MSYLKSLQKSLSLQISTMLVSKVAEPQSESGSKTESPEVENRGPQPENEIIAQVSSQLPYSTFTRAQKGWIIFVVAWAGWFSTASSFIYFPAIPFLAQDMDVSVQRINLTVTSYMIASGIFPTITGQFTDKYGRRPGLIITVALYVIINISLAVQRSYAALFVLRMLQSAAISGNLDTRAPETQHVHTWRPESM